MIHSKLLAEIHRIMKERRLSRSELARRIGCSPGNVTKLLDPEGNPTVESLDNLVTALGVDDVELALVSSATTTKPRSRRGPDPGPKHDYTPHLRYMEDAIATGASQRQAAEQASNWASEAGHAAVSAETLRRYYREQCSRATSSAESVVRLSTPLESLGTRVSTTRSDVIASLSLAASDALASIELDVEEIAQAHDRFISQATRPLLAAPERLSASFEGLTSAITACLRS